MKSETIDTLSATGTKTIVTGVSMTGWGWFTSNEFFGLIGVAVDGSPSGFDTRIGGAIVTRDFLAGP